MLGVRVLTLIAALTSFALAAPAPVPSPVERRWSDIDRFWRHKDVTPSFIDFTRRQSDDSLCNLANAKMPAAPTPLPKPAAGLFLTHVAIGRGTQNYTCDTSNSTAVPVAAGAVAVLYNVSCIAADSPQLLERLPQVALNLDVPSSSKPSSPAYNDLSGHHYFTDLTTAFFDLDTSLHQYGSGSFKKVNASAPPADAPQGQYGQGHGSVPWLKLDAKDGKGQVFQDVYRLVTAGGNPPKTCTGSEASFQVEYAAQYWIYSK